MYEYIIFDTMDSYKVEGSTIHIRIPQAAVLFLRSSEDTPDSMGIVMEWEDGSNEIPVRVLRVRDYSLEELFRKRLYFLLPYYIFTHEAGFRQINNSAEGLELLTGEYGTIIRELQ
jgi:hypothetical protein